MTPRDALDCAPTTTKCPVLINGVDGVLAACGMKAALPAQELTQGGAVEDDELDEQATHYRIVVSEYKWPQRHRVHKG
jgi:hypothetical protein